jgi:hypothetical protein
MQVKNWAKFQHFKDRRPPWVKLYRDILDDIEWHKLDGDSAKMLINIWLIASEYSGEVPDTATLAFRLRITENQVKKALSSLGHWLISERYQDDISVIQKISATDIEVPLREREETETEKETFTSPDKLATCPTEKIVQLYNQTLHELPSVKLMTDKRKKAIGKFWRFVLTSKKSDGQPRAENSEQALDWIEAYFLRVLENDFLMGKTGRTGEHSKWQCDLDYLLTDKGMTQVIEKTRSTE